MPAVYVLRSSFVDAVKLIWIEAMDIIAEHGDTATVETAGGARYTLVRAHCYPSRSTAVIAAARYVAESNAQGVQAKFRSGG